MFDITIFTRPRSFLPRIATVSKIELIFIVGRIDKRMTLEAWKKASAYVMLYAMLYLLLCYDIIYPIGGSLNKTSFSM